MSKQTSIVSIDNNSSDWCTLNVAKNKKNDTSTSGYMVSTGDQKDTDAELQKKYWVLIATKLGVYSVQSIPDSEGENWTLTIYKGGTPEQNEEGYNIIDGGVEIFEIAVPNNTKLDLEIYGPNDTNGTDGEPYFVTD